MKTLAIIFAILIVSIGGWYFYTSFRAPGGIGQKVEEDKSAGIADKVKSDNLAPTLTPTPTMVPPPQAVKINKEVVVLMTAERFIPSSITLNVGDSLKFINQDSRAHWPASDAHPVHLCYSGFDSMGGVKPGESFSFKFTVKKSCGFHDHLNPSLNGNVVVE